MSIRLLLTCLSLTFLPSCAKNKAFEANKQGLAYFKSYHYKNALEEFTKAIKLNPRFAEAYSNRAGLYIRKGDYNSAIEDCIKAVNIDPVLPNAYMYMGYANRALENNEKSNNDYAMALQLYSKNIEVDPYDAKTYFERGLTLVFRSDIKKNDKRASISDFSEAIRLNPRMDEAFSYRCRQYAFTFGKYENAIDDCSKAIEINPMNADAYFHLSYLYAGGQRSDYDEAIKYLNKAIEIDHAHAPKYSLRAMVFRFKGDERMALEDITKAIKLDPKEDGYYSDRGEIYAKSGKNTLALQDFTRAIELNPKSASAYHNRAQIYSKRCMFDEALADSEKAHALAPEIYPDSNKDLLSSRISKRGQNKRIIHESSIAISKNPNDAAAYYRRGLSYYEDCEYEKAIFDIKKSLNIDNSAEKKNILEMIIKARERF